MERGLFGPASVVVSLLIVAPGAPPRAGDGIGCETIPGANPSRIDVAVCSWNISGARNFTAQSFLARDRYLVNAGIHLAPLNYTSPGHTFPPVTIQLWGDRYYYYYGMPNKDVIIFQSLEYPDTSQGGRYRLCPEIPIPLILGARYWIVASIDGPATGGLEVCGSSDNPFAEGYGLWSGDGAAWGSPYMDQFPGPWDSNFEVDFATSCPECDCNGNGVPDGLDLQSGTSKDTNQNGAPDDCEPPNPPRELKADPGPRRIQLTWEEPDAGPDFQGYAVYRELMTYPPTGAVRIAELPLASRSFLDEALEGGKYYCYEVRAAREPGFLSPSSNRACASPRGDVVFRRGDAEANGILNISDPIVILRYLFVGGVDIECLDAADVEDSGSIDVSDPIYLLNYLFLGEVPKPLPDCGADATEDGIGCLSYPSC